MAISAPKVIKFNAARLVTDQLWLMYRFEWLDGTPIDIRTWGLRLFGSNESQPEPEEPMLPTSVIGDDHDHLQLLVAKPSSVLTIGPANTTAQKFVVRMSRQDAIGEVSLSYTYMAIDSRPTFDDDTYSTWSIYPEVFVLKIDPATMEIVGDELGIPNSPMVGMIPYFEAANMDEAEDLAAGSRKFIEVMDIDVVYLFRPGKGMKEVTLI